MSGMKPFVTPVVIALIAAASSFELAAQWPDWRMSGAPRLANGKVNMAGPVPKTADGKPDLSGVWENVPNRIGGRGVPELGSLGLGPPPPPPPPSDPALGPPPATFFNIGAGFKEGLPLRPWAAEVLKKRTEENAKDNPDAHCLPMGLMQLHLHPQPRKMIETRGLIVMIYEGNQGLRQIFTDGRPLPPKGMQPWWYGYSVGKWDGDTLVVETTGFRDDVWLDVNGSPMTEEGKLTERYRRTDFGHLEIIVTVDDPKAYTKPFTVRVNQRLMPDTDLIEFICGENEKSDAHLVGK
jgi:hypothetical protein